MTCQGVISHLKHEPWCRKRNWWVNFESINFHRPLLCSVLQLVLVFLQKTENYIKNEDKEERLIKNAPERIKEAKIDTLKEKRDVPKIDLEMPNRDNDSLTRDKLEGKGMSQELPPKLTDPKVEKTGTLTFFPPVIYIANVQLYFCPNLFINNTSCHFYFCV